MNYSLTVQKRQEKDPAITRTQGFVPGVVYGPDRQPVSIMVNYVELEKLYKKAGESNLIDLTIEGEKPAKVLIQDLQFDPLKDRVSHVDFRQINMSAEMELAITINFVGESPAVKSLGGTLVQNNKTVNVRCLPDNLIGQVDVDLSVLQTFADAIHVKDIKVPAGITVIDNPENVIAKVLAPLTEDQIKAMEEAGPQSLEDIEVEKKGKVAEEGEEGAAEAGAEKKEEKAKE